MQGQYEGCQAKSGPTKMESAEVEEPHVQRLRSCLINHIAYKEKTKKLNVAYSKSVIFMWLQQVRTAEEREARLQQLLTRMKDS